jgi:PTH1 family peptidyl-tRNA hydrolase
VRWGLPRAKDRFRGSITEGRISLPDGGAHAGALGPRVAVLRPQTYMNDSGRSVVALVRRHGIDDLAQLVVVHDELDLPVGRIQVKEGGGIAGHNGLRSIRDHLHTTEFVRVHVGIGRPPGAQQGADYVLGRPSKSERQELTAIVGDAADAVETILREGPAGAMNRFNTRQ